MSRRITTVAFLIGSPLLLNVISIPATAYIIRQLGPQGYGTWSVAVALVGTTAFLSNLGLRTLYIRSVAQDPERGTRSLADQLGLRSLLAVVAGILALLLCLCLGYGPVALQCVGLTAVAGVLAAMGGVAGDVLQGLQSFNVYVKVNFIAGLLLTAASVIAVGIHLGPVGLTASYVVGPLTNLTLLLIQLRRRNVPLSIRWDLKCCIQLLKEVRTMGAQQLLSAIQGQIEPLLVSKLHGGVANLGYFSAGAMPANRLGIVPDSMATVLYPEIARRSRNEAQGASPLVVRLFAMSVILCVPISVLVMFLAQPIAEILFRHYDVMLCRNVMCITIWCLPLSAILLSMIYSLQAVGAYNNVARSGMASTLAGIALSCFLVIRFDVIGACWSMIGRTVLSVLWLLPRFIRTFPGVLPRMPMGRVLCCAVVMTMPMWPSTSWLHRGLLGPFVGSLLAFCVYLVALLLLRVITISELQWMFGRRTMPIE